MGPITSSLAWLTHDRDGVAQVQAAMIVVRAVFDVGVLLRRDFRRKLMAAGLRFTEDKGWIDSRFVVTATKAELNPFYRLAQEAETA
jgi:hypothetical protein